MQIVNSRVLMISLGVSALLGLASCASNPAGAGKADAGGAASESSALAAKQKEYDQMLKEWKNLKPGLTRMVAIEGELKQLMIQLEKMSTETKVNPPATSAAPVAANEPLVETVSTPAPIVPLAPSRIAEPIENKAVENKPVVAAHLAASGNFALQVASTTARDQLPQIWQQMVQRNPQVLAPLAPNFQKTNVKNTDYYRLKLGSFLTQQEASQKCSDLKNLGISCFVVSYSDSNFAQLSNG
jgi:hypothetical protein